MLSRARTIGVLLLGLAGPAWAHPCQSDRIYPSSVDGAACAKARVEAALLCGDNPIPWPVRTPAFVPDSCPAPGFIVGDAAHPGRQFCVRLNAIEWPYYAPMWSYEEIIPTPEPTPE